MDRCDFSFHPEPCLKLHCLSWNVDELAKRREMLFSVIPAEAGIQSFWGFLDSRLRGSDDLKTSYEAINVDQVTNGHS